MNTQAQRLTRRSAQRPSAAQRARPAWVVATLLGAALFGGCHKGSVGGSASNLPQGSVAVTPNQAPGGNLAFIVTPNDGGRKTNLRLLGIRWGRLADIRDITGVLRHEDFVVDENVQSGNEYVVEINPVSEKTTVTIRSPFSTELGSPYVTRLNALEAGLTVLDDKSLDPSELPPFPLVPRNATLVLEFDDLIDPATISTQTVKIMRGYPPNSPFDARLLPDSNHGDLANFDGVPGLEFYSTRVIVDTTVSAIEAATTNPPLPINTLGLPASLTQGQPNIVVRIPTKTDPQIGQTQLLRNPSNHALGLNGNGSMDSASSTRDIVRALRSGGGALGDVNNGFLVDTVRPSVLGTQAAFVQNLAAGPTPATFVCDLNFALSACASRLIAGDVIQQGGVFGEILCPPFQTCAPDAEVTGPVLGSVVQTVYFRIIATDVGGPQGLEIGPAQISMRFHAAVPTGKAPCFVRFPAVTLPPDQGVSPSSSIIVRFTEPMDPVSVKPFDSLMLMRRDPATNPTPNAYDFVVGAVTSSADQREFTFTPALPLTHTPPATEEYFLRIISGAGGPTDLPGNTLASQVPAIRFRLDSVASAQNTSGFALRFNSSDEISGIGGDTSTVGVGKRELRGQFLINTQAEVLRPRPVTHFTAAADRTQAVPSIMAPFATGVQTPLSKLGSKMQTLWRYCDVGFGLLDEANYNVDVEGMAWAPIGGSAAVADNFTRFEMSLSHCLRLPDETLNAALLPNFPTSGLVTTYSLNQLSSATDPLRKVYPIPGGPSGYAVIPTDVFQGPTGTNFMPWPMNRNIPTRNFVFYTWRDTALLARGGPADSPGAELPIVFQVTGITPATPGVPYGQNNVATVGLPLLMEFRCYPDDGALGLNAFDISVVTASSSRPNFRAFSTGGVNTGGIIVKKDPDLQTIANGGFNPTSTPSPGATTIPVDNSFYIGQLNLVTRISRVHSIWFDSTSGTVLYSAPVVEPRPTDQPEGTSIVFDYRGATQLTNNVLLSDAVGIDPYGNRVTLPAGAPLGGTTDPTFLNNDTTWKSSLTALNGARFFQVRASFISNAETNLSPELSALGFTYRR
ncbi:MAG: hypothetical protein JNL28_05405 [Planctomycetes bacterium]|nr:hypothetical protein [Planctomycetota bacterium]